MRKITKNPQPSRIFVGQILAAKQKDPDVDTSALERWIDQMVCNLYNLTEEEIKIVEQSNRQCTNMRYQIYSDESGHERFRSVGALSGEKANIDKLRN